MLEIDTILLKNETGDWERKERTHAAGLVLSQLKGRDKRIDLLLALRTENKQLLNAMATQIGVLTENARLSRQLHDSYRDLDSLRQELAESKDAVNKLKKELHDGAGQLLTVLKLGLSLIYEDLSEEHVEQRRQIQESLSLTDEIMDDLRRLTRR